MRITALSFLLASLLATTNAAQACTQPNVLPQIQTLPPTLGFSGFLAGANLHGTTQLIVTLQKDGGFPASVDVQRSSGYDAIDQAARADALRTLFSPEFRDCSPIGGQYLISIEY